MKLRTLLVLAAITLAIGCGSAPSSSVTPSGYKAFGDSITWGYALPSQMDAYPELMGYYLGLDVYNGGIVGQEACDNANNVIINTAPVLGVSQPLITNMIGTNDAAYKGQGAYEATFNICNQAALSWAGVPASSKVRADSGSISGQCFEDAFTQFPDNGGMACTAPGATITLSVATGGGPLYIWPRFIDADGCKWTYSVDGGVATVVATALAAPIDTVVGGMWAYGLLRVPVAAGTHTVVFTQITAGTMVILGLGTPSSAPMSQLPYVIDMTLPNELNGTNQIAVSAYRADEVANYNLLRGDGLDIYLDHVENYMSATSLDMADTLHPNILGQQEMYQSIRSTITVQPGDYTVVPSTGTGIVAWDTKI